jgi:hypothetical protein
VKLATHLERSAPWRPFEIGAIPFMHQTTMPQNRLFNRFLLLGERTLVAHYAYYKPEEGQVSHVQFIAYKNAQMIGEIYLRLDVLLLLSQDSEKIVVWRFNDCEQEFYRMCVSQNGRVRVEQWAHPQRVERITFTRDEWSYILQEIEAIPNQGHHASAFPRLEQLPMQEFPVYRLPGGCPDCETGPGKCTCEGGEDEEEEPITLNEHGQRKYGWSILRPFETVYGNHVSSGLLISAQRIVVARYSEPQRFLRNFARWWDRSVAFSLYEGGIKQQESLLPYGILKVLKKRADVIAPEHPSSLDKMAYRLLWNKQGVTVERNIAETGQRAQWSKERFSWEVWQILLGALPDFVADWRELYSRRHERFF